MVQASATAFVTGVPGRTGRISLCYARDARDTRAVPDRGIIGEAFAPLPSLYHSFYHSLNRGIYRGFTVAFTVAFTVLFAVPWAILY